MDTTTTPTTPISRTNARAWLAGTGATGALIGAALLVFLSAAAFVGFNGLVVGGTNNPTPESVTLTRSSAVAAATAAARAAAPATGAVAPRPAPGFGPGPAAGGPGSGGPNGPGGGPGQPGPGQANTLSAPSGQLGSTSGGTGGEVPTPPPASTPEGPVSSATHAIDNTTGVDTSGPTAPIATQLDNTLNQVLPGGGSPAPTTNGQLGGTIGHTVTTVTGPILGGG